VKTTDAHVTRETLTPVERPTPIRNTAAHDVQIRTTEPTRAAWVTSCNVTDRTVGGVVCPWNERTDAVKAGAERILRDAFAGSYDRTQPRQLLFRYHGHGQAVGKATMIWPSEAGLVGRFAIRRGPIGDEVLEEVRDGLLPGFSIGFHPVEVVRGDDGVREVARARLMEVSLVTLPAYDGAVVDEVDGQPVQRDVPRWLIDPHTAALRRKVEALRVTRPAVDLSPFPEPWRRR
jgi:HK97 family phage prohead protease